MENPRRIYNPVQKDYATFLKTTAETNGEYTLVEVELAAGGGVGILRRQAKKARSTGLDLELIRQYGDVLNPQISGHLNSRSGYSKNA